MSDYEEDWAELAAENERLRAALETLGLDLRSAARVYPGAAGRAFQSAGNYAMGVINQQPVSIAEMQQPDEHRKNAEAKARLDAISGHQQQLNTEK